jgi:hypothetical protein
VAVRISVVALFGSFAYVWELMRSLVSSSNRHRLWLTLVVFGVVVRLAIVIIPDNHLRAPWSGGGDAPVYVLLAQNLLQGRGFTYCLQPTALRAPGYPILLAVLMWLSPGWYVVIVRGVQFLSGLATVYFCSRGALVFGKNAGRAAALIGLFCPTLLFVTGEVLTECIAAFFGALFLFLLVRGIENPTEKTFAEMGIVTGAASIFRFNMAGLGFVGAPVALLIGPGRRRWHRAAAFCLLTVIPVVPWIVRNQVAFHKLVYSTLSGHDAVEGIVAPQGRALPGDNARIEGAEGWLLSDIETNNPSRLRFPSEDRLNSEAWASARTLWREWRWRLVPLVFAKLSYFWLSLDQVLWTQSFSLPQRLFRWSGVLVYWALLALAILGWFRLRRSKPLLARVFLFYAIVLTALHLPFPMITRLRIPLIDPVIVILSGAAFSKSRFDLAVSRDG